MSSAFEIFSLLASLGNCSNNHCGAAVSCSEIGGLGRKATIFPVKFPVCRESEWRLVRTALGRQPASATFLDRYGGIAERPANSGLSGIGASSPRSQSVILGGQIAESLQPIARIFPFSGDYRRRLGSIATARLRIAVQIRALITIPTALRRVTCDWMSVINGFSKRKARRSGPGVRNFQT